MGFEKRVQLIENEARIHRHGSRLGIERPDLAQVLACIDHHSLADGLTALGRPGAARQQRHIVLGGDLDGSEHILPGSRDDHAKGLDLVDRGVRAVTAAAERVEQHFALEFPAQPGGERRDIQFG